MCARYNLRSPLNVLLDQFAAELQEAAVWEPRYNIPPTANVPAIRLVEGTRQLALLKWGLVPSWAKDTKIAYSTINARADTVATKPAFRTAYKKRRCLVPATGYYEWETIGKSKLPWLYEIDGGKPFAFAGLWEQWFGHGDGQPPLETCTILTTEPNELAARFHDRMPVILHPDDYDAWLEGEQIPLVSFEAERMTAKPLSTFVNNVKNQGPECIAPREGSR
jgi:putative SOS response-associated peptidase YedK